MLNLDFSKRVVIDTNTEPWSASPMAGVFRKPLSRDEAERGHATSIVRYEPASHFSEHGHPLGEEILVLEGTFSDHTGDYSAGTYFRNPDGFRHAPRSDEGALILVKLHQFQTGDEERVVLDTQTQTWVTGESGVDVMPLHQFGDEQVRLERYRPDTNAERHVHRGWEEIYVISGELSDDWGVYPAGTWMRNPDGSEHRVSAEAETVVWVKSGLGASSKS
jgi:anti-sigma factor ChrR (cupin superfamily)